MGHIRPVPVKKGFADIWQWLQAAGQVSLTSTGGKAFTAIALVTEKGDHAGEKAIVVDAPPGQSSAYIYECCWGWGQNHSGVRIGQFVKPLDNADP